MLLITLFKLVKSIHILVWCERSNNSQIFGLSDWIK